MTRRLLGWTLVATLLVSTTPLDLVFGAPRPLGFELLSAASEPAASTGEGMPIAPLGQSQCPEGDQHLCCPWSAHALPVQQSISCLLWRIPVTGPVLAPRRLLSREPIERIFHPPRNA